MCYVLGIGFGILNAAWTAKIIFVRSTQPGYFCYLFPWFYCPVSWVLNNLIHQVVADWRLSIGLAVMSFWPIPITMISWRYSLHKPLSVARAMSLTNNLLIIYYVFLIISIAFILWFILGYHPDGSDFLSEQLRGDFSPVKAFQTYVLNRPLSNCIPDLIDSLLAYFLTVCAVTDGFICVICSEHEEAWRMSGNGTGAVNARLAVEEAVIRDWLKLIKGKLKTPQTSSQAIAVTSRQLVNEEDQSIVELQDIGPRRKAA